MAESKMIHSVQGLINKTKDYIRRGKSCEQIQKIMHTLVVESADLSPSLIDEVVSDTCAEYPDYDLIQKVVKNKLVRDIDGDFKTYFIIDEDSRDVQSISSSVLASLFCKTYSFKDKLYTASFDYRPDVLKILLKEGTKWVYNTYDPPPWLIDHFYSAGKVPVEKESVVPEMYDKFFRHLLDNDQSSYDYLLDWLANAMRSKNYCILCTIGAKGIGKGILGSIMMHLVGEKNYNETKTNMLNSNFNGQLKDKKIVYIDEINVTSAREEDTLKLMVNDYIEIEQKGIDAKLCRNFANIYISSNNLDSIQLSGDQRRFSIVNLTEEKLLNKMSFKQIADLKDPKNVKKLAHFLFHREVDEDKMLKVFISERTEQVRFHSMNSWQEWLLFEYAPDYYGKPVKVTDIGSAVEDHFGSKQRPGRPALLKLQNRFPEFLEVKKVKNNRKQEWIVEFKDPDNAKTQIRA